MLILNTIEVKAGYLLGLKTSSHILVLFVTYDVIKCTYIHHTHHILEHGRISEHGLYRRRVWHNPTRECWRRRIRILANPNAATTNNITTTLCTPRLHPRHCTSNFVPCCHQPRPCIRTRSENKELRPTIDVIVLNFDSKAGSEEDIWSTRE